MAFEVIWHEDVLKDLKKLDKQVAKKIITKVKNYLLQNPEKLGKPLKGNFTGLYRYRIGDYRIIYSIERGLKLIRVLSAGHRKEIYKDKD